MSLTALPIPGTAPFPDPMHLYRARRDRERRTVLKTYKILGFISSGTYGRVYKAVLLAPPKAPNLAASTRAAVSLTGAGDKDKTDKASAAAWGDIDPRLDPLSNPELCMRPGDRPAKEGEVFAIKKFKPDKEGDVQTYAGISQSGAREIMVSPPGEG